MHILMHIFMCVCVCFSPKYWTDETTKVETGLSPDWVIYYCSNLIYIIYAICAWTYIFSDAHHK